MAVGCRTMCCKRSWPSDANVLSVCGAESATSPALFLLRNFNPQHLFKDMALSSSEGPCWMHSKCCKVGPSEVDIYIAGLVCKRNSCQNSQRYQDSRDPIDPSTPEVQTFVESVNCAQRQKPMMQDFPVLTACNSAFNVPWKPKTIEDRELEPDSKPKSLNPQSYISLYNPFTDNPVRAIA